MSHILRHFSLHVETWNGVIVVALFVVWCGVIGCAISSILAQPFERRQHIFWIAVVVLLPVIGLLGYLPYSFRKEDLPHIFVRRRNRSKRDRELDSDQEP